jgi:hypothetical protein
MTPRISLAGKRVLYVAPRFFGYDLDIEEELGRRGARVVRLVDRPFDTPLMTAVTKVAPAAISRAALPCYRRAIEAEEPFDLVLVINGQTVSRLLLDQVRWHSPRATFVLYLWDALDNRGSILPLLTKYDHIFGFDRADAQRHGFGYRPLFFAPVFDAAQVETPRFDISFIGTAHTDRAPIVYAIDAILPDAVSRFWHLYLQAPWVRRYYAARDPAFRHVPPSIFRFHSMPRDEIGRVFRQSRAILDIEHPLQRGLTMRTFETLGAGKKLVTTNRHVVDEHFYHPDNVLVVDRRNIVISPSFFDRPATPVSATVRQRYTLAGWLDEILEGAGIGGRPVRSDGVSDKADA